MEEDSLSMLDAMEIQPEAQGIIAFGGDHAINVKLLAFMIFRLFRLSGRCLCCKNNQKFAVPSKTLPRLNPLLSAKSHIPKSGFSSKSSPIFCSETAFLRGISRVDLHRGLFVLVFIEIISSR